MWIGSLFGIHPFRELKNMPGFARFAQNYVNLMIVASNGTASRWNKLIERICVCFNGIFISFLFSFFAE